MPKPLLGAALPCNPGLRVEFRYVELDEQAPAPGTWFFLHGKPCVCCPRCGVSAQLHAFHKVEDRTFPALGVVAGDVNPSIECPFVRCGDGEARCDAHYYARLLKWAHEP